MELLLLLFPKVLPETWARVVLEVVNLDPKNNPGSFLDCLQIKPQKQKQNHLKETCRKTSEHVHSVYGATLQNTAGFPGKGTLTSDQEAEIKVGEKIW